MIDLIEKVIRPFAVLKISDNPLATHCQATQTKGLQKGCNFANAQ
jgi:hypothetical protein